MNNSSSTLYISTSTCTCIILPDVEETDAIVAVPSIGVHTGSYHLIVYTMMYMYVQVLYM